METVQQQPLHVKYRPKSWSQIRGERNKKTIENIMTVLADGKVTTFLISGPTGCGKTTIARLIKESVGCSDIDFQEINASNNRGIDTIREIIQDCRFKPLSGSARVFLLDECHQITGSAAEALLKITEEAPPGVIFVLATTNPEKLTATLKGRCTPFVVHRLQRDERRGIDELKDLLKEVVKEEGFVGVTEKVLDRISEEVEGTPRDALVLLEKLKDFGTEAEMLNAVESQIGIDRGRDLARALLRGKWEDAYLALLQIEISLDDPEGIRRTVLGYMAKIIISDDQKEKDMAKAAAAIRLFSDALYSSGRPGLYEITYRFYHGC